MIERHYGVVNKGRILQTDRNTQRYKATLSRLEGKEVEWVLTEVRKHATSSQYGYYRKAIISTCQNATEMFGGWEDDDIADFFENKFLGYVTEKKLGNEIVRIPRKTLIENLSVKDMSDFIDKVIRFLQYNGISIGSPDDYKL